MRAATAKSMIAALSVLLFAAGQASAAETLRLAGTGGAMAMAEQIAAEFAVSTGIKIQVVPGLGSKGGISAAADGAVDLGVEPTLENFESSSLGITTTAEGVETKEQLASLTSEGCNEFQGFLFSKPQRAADVQRLLGEQAPRAEAVA
mgnify:CR=1 FL=1